MLISRTCFMSYSNKSSRSWAMPTYPIMIQLSGYNSKLVTATWHSHLSPDLVIWVMTGFTWGGLSYQLQMLSIGPCLSMYFLAYLSVFFICTELTWLKFGCVVGLLHHRGCWDFTFWGTGRAKKTQAKEAMLKLLEQTTSFFGGLQFLSLQFHCQKSV